MITFEVGVDYGAVGLVHEVEKVSDGQDAFVGSIHLREEGIKVHNLFGVELVGLAIFLHPVIVEREYGTILGLSLGELLRGRQKCAG